MLESRDMTNVPVIVAANKMDCVTTADAVAIRERKDIVHLVNVGHGFVADFRAKTH